MKRPTNAPRLFLVALTLTLSVAAPTAQAQAVISAPNGAQVRTLSAQQQQEYTRMVASHIKEMAAQAHLDQAQREQVQSLLTTLDQFAARPPQDVAPMSVSLQMVAPQGLAPGLLGAQGMANLSASAGGGVMGAQGMHAQGLTDVGGLDTILDILNFAAQFIPGLGPLVSTITSSIAKMIADTALLAPLMSMWSDYQKFQDLIGKVRGLTDLNGMLGKAPSLWNQISTMAGGYGVKLATFNLSSISDVQRAVQVAQSGSFEGVRKSVETLLKDAYGKQVGIPGATYANATNLDAAMGSILNRMRAADLANHNINSAGTAAEARIATDELSKDSAATAAQAAVDATTIATTGAATMTSLGATKVLIGAQAQAIKYQQYSASQMMNGFRQMTLASDAEREVQGAILDHLVQQTQDKVQAAEQQINAEADARTKAAQVNAAAAMAVGEVVQGSQLDDSKVRSFSDMIKASGN